MDKTVCIIQEINGNIRLNYRKVDALLQRASLANKSVVIVSIAGCLRSGKSFLLNYLLRYLREKGWENSNWIENDKTTDVLSWRGGTKADTRGIHIWDEVFQMKTSDGHEVSVLLMDTQGLFDINSTKEMDTRLFMLTALASSVQILNIQGLIQGRDLDNLHLCVELANAAASSGKVSTSNLKLGKLIFLVRDWAHVHEHGYGSGGGSSYLSGVLSEKTGGDELDIVREYLKNTFQELSCFLLPHPGLDVTKVNTFKGKNSEVSEDFLKTVNTFVEEILHPDKLMSTNSYFKTGRALLNMFKACDDVFESGKLMEAPLLIEATAKAHYTTALEECLSEYESNIKITYDTKGPMQSGELGQVHSETLKKILEMFDSSLKFGPEKIRMQYKAQLEEKCCESFKHWKNINQLELQVIELVLRNKMDEAMEQYEEYMTEADNLMPIADEKLDDLHQTSTEKVLASFVDTRINCVNLLSKYKKKLQKQMQSYFSNVKTRNKSIRWFEEQKKYTQDETNLFGLVQRLADEYGSSLQKLRKKYFVTEQIEKECEIQKEKAKNRFAEETKDINQSLVIKYQTLLNSNLEDKTEICMRRNKEHQWNLREKLDLSTEKLVMVYEKEVRTMMKHFSPSDEFLKLYQESSLKYIEVELREMSGNLDKTIIEDAKRKAERDMLKVFGEISRLRKENTVQDKDKRNVFIIQMTEKFGKIATDITETLMTGLKNDPELENELFAC